MTQTNLAISRPPRITVIDARAPEKAKLRVAAYARVSSDSDDQVNSYLAQVDHYTRHIASKEDWELVDIYADEGISGLEAQRRDDFNRMLADCRAGKIDRLLVKSTSRFARNTKEYIQYVRELLRLGVSICFEKENIDTGKMTSEQVAQIYGAFAQMESTNHSANMRISMRLRMENGEFLPPSAPYGYRLDTGEREMKIIPEEADVVLFRRLPERTGQGRHLQGAERAGRGAGQVPGAVAPQHRGLHPHQYLLHRGRALAKELRHQRDPVPAGPQPGSKAQILCGGLPRTHHQQGGL